MRVGVLRPDVREQEEHQQGPASRAQVDAVSVEAGGGGVAPVEVGVVLADVPASIDVPAVVARRFGIREADRERPQSFARQPTPGSDELVKGSVKPVGGGGRPERWIAAAGDADHRARPGRGVVGVASRFLAHSRERHSSASSRSNAAPSSTKPSRTKRSICSSVKTRVVIYPAVLAQQGTPSVRRPATSSSWSRSNGGDTGVATG